MADCKCASFGLAKFHVLLDTILETEVLHVLT